MEKQPARRVPESGHDVNSKVVSWWSGGVTSAVATKIAIDTYGKDMVRVIFMDTKNEHEDTYRFMQDCQEWYGIEIETISRIPDDYKSIQEVWLKYLSLNVANGAICSSELKRDLRLKWEKENTYSHQVFGFDIDEPKRAKAMALNHEQASPVFTLLLKGYSKKKCIEILRNNGIEIPEAYKLGFNNNNCFATGCVQGGIGYWQKMQRDFPDKFDKMAKMEHELTDMKGQPVAMNKDQTKAAAKKPFSERLIFLRKHPDYDNICIDDKPSQEMKSISDCNGFCFTNDLVKDIGSNSTELEKPTMEKYGWHTQNGFDDEPSGWMHEGGEDAYYEALKEWEAKQSERLKCNCKMPSERNWGYLSDPFCAVCGKDILVEQ
jgi:3'-phosphoadenosine 5'-phosphosulfate sulfotransferase (PAPS reductase)/FAD synthetase